MRFLLDVNVGSRIARALVDAGHDVVRAAHVDPKAVDEALVQVAIEQDRVIVTRDRDFGALMFKAGSPHPPGIIYIRAAASEAGDLAARLIDLIEPDRILGHMTVLRAEHYRRTPFPARSNDNG